MSSRTDKLSGKVNQVVGKATGNNKVEAKGKAQEAKGIVKDKIKAAGEAVSDKVDKAANKTDL